MALQTYPIPNRNYNTGVAAINSATVPVGARQLVLTFNTSNWTNPASRLVIAMELSQDNGVTWSGGGATDMQCRPDGTFRDRTGAILPTVFASFTWPANVTHLRGSLTVEGASIRTSGSIEVN